MQIAEQLTVQRDLLELGRGCFIGRGPPCLNKAFSLCGADGLKQMMEADRWCAGIPALIWLDSLDRSLGKKIPV